MSIPCPDRQWTTQLLTNRPKCYEPTKTPSRAIVAKTSWLKLRKVKSRSLSQCPRLKAPPWRSGTPKNLIHQLLGHLKSATDFELDACLGTDAACGRLCCVADAPDSGLRNHRFQNIACHFKSRRFDEWKISFWRQFCDLGMTSRTIVILAQF